MDIGSACSSRGMERPRTLTESTAIGIGVALAAVIVPGLRELRRDMWPPRSARHASRDVCKAARCRHVTRRTGHDLGDGMKLGKIMPTAFGLGMLAVGLKTLSGCSDVAAVATAPVTLPVMAVSARLNDGGPSIEEQRQSPGWRADEALVRALERDVAGTVETWTSPHGPSSGSASLLERTTGSEGQPCWRVRRAGTVAGQVPETSVQTFCPVGRNGWAIEPDR